LDAARAATTNAAKALRGEESLKEAVAKQALELRRVRGYFCAQIGERIFGSLENL
jgi:hypothetical protein